MAAFEFAAHLRRQRVQPADGLQADIVLLQVGQFLLEVVAQQPPRASPLRARGRFQFSTEKAYRVSTWTPSRAQVSTVERTGPMPALWPATRGKQPASGPAAVAVHDDGDMRGQTGRDRGLGPDSQSFSPGWSDSSKAFMK